MNGDGEKNCYEIAGRLIGTLRNSTFLCNGYIYSTKLKRYIRHAWVEDDRSVWDYSNNRRLILPKVDYYREGKINGIVQRYSRLEALEMIKSTGKFEFWNQDVRQKILGDK